MFKFIRTLLLSMVMAFGVVVAVSAADLLNINTASAEEIAEYIDGVGEKKAAAIVKYREENGYFNSVDQLTNVNGIGEKTVEDLNGRLTFEVPLKKKN